MALFDSLKTLYVPCVYCNLANDSIPTSLLLDIQRRNNGYQLLPPQYYAQRKKKAGKSAEWISLNRNRCSPKRECRCKKTIMHFYVAVDEVSLLLL